MELILALAAGLAIFLLVVGAAFAPRPNVVQARLGELGSAEGETLEQIELRQPLFDRTIRPFVSRLAALGQRLASPGNLNRTERRLAMAGSPGGLRATDFAGIKALFAIMLGAIVFLVLATLSRNPLVGGLMTAAAVGIGWLLPEFWLGRRIGQRQRLILRALPDTLDLLTISIRAGLGFDGAMAKVIEKSRGPLADEFRRVIAEIRIGRTRREALRDMTVRANVSPLTTFVGAIIQADQLGVSISKVLQVQSDQLRIERRQRAEELANQAPIKMLFPLVGCIFPSMFIVILGPAMIVLLRDLGRV